MQNQAWYYVKTPGAGRTKAADIYECRPEPMPEVKEGMFLARKVAIAIAPLSRAYLKLPGNDTGAEAMGITRKEIGEIIPAESVGVVIESKSKKYKAGDRVWLPLKDLTEYSAHYDDGRDDAGKFAPPKLLGFVRTESQISTLSPAAGVTAYLAINHHACARVDESGCGSGCFSFLKRSILCRSKPKKTVLVTSAAGAVGIVAGQLYKNKGCKTIGVTSSKAKAEKLLEYGYDCAIAYKEEDMDARLSELAPEGIDVFFDNVGAEQLDIGTKHMKVGGRICSVGATSEIDNFTTGNIKGYSQYLRVVARELTFGGFLMSGKHHIKRIPQAMLGLGMMLYRGKVKPAETVVEGTFKDWGDCLDRLFDSDAFGRLILVNKEAASLVTKK